MTQPRASRPGLFHGQNVTENSLDALLADLTDEPVADTETNSEAEHEAQASEPADETESQEPETETEAEPEGDEPEGEDKDKDEDKDEPEEPKKKKLSGSERLKRRIAALEAELTERRAAPAPAGDDLAKALETEIGAPPKEEDFKGDYLAYERALTAYETEKRIVARDIKRQLATQQVRAQAAQIETIEEHKERLDELEKAQPGSRAKLAKAAKSGLSPADHVAALVLESEKSAYLAVHLADHPDLVADLNRMNPVKAAREIGRLEARLSLPKPKTATKAPPPVAPVRGAASPSSPDKDLTAWLSKQYGRR